MNLKRLGRVAICVNDIDSSAAFYQNLGMDLVWKDTDWAYLKAGEDGLALLSPGYDQAGLTLVLYLAIAPRWKVPIIA